MVFRELAASAVVASFWFLPVVSIADQLDYQVDETGLIIDDDSFDAGGAPEDVIPAPAEWAYEATDIPVDDPKLYPLDPVPPREPAKVGFWEESEESSDTDSQEKEKRDSSDRARRRLMLPEEAPRRHLMQPGENTFMFLFFSDLEEEYRDHSNGLARLVVNELIEQSERNIYFDPPFDNIKFDPELYIHGGDAANFWKGFKTRATLEPIDRPWRRDTWSRFFKKDKLLLSGMGNHDWIRPQKNADKEAWRKRSTINEATNNFVRWSFEESKELSKGALTYEEIKPKKGLGQSYFIANYRGVQFAFQNMEVHNPVLSDDGERNLNDGDEQWDEFKKKIDTEKPTIFVSHIPVRGQIEKGKIALEEVLKNWGDRHEEIVKPVPSSGEKYPSAAHFSGHTHSWHDEQVDEQVRVRDYTVSYPYDNYHAGHERGYYAVLVSGDHGVLQVKRMGFDDGCWKRGTICGPGTTCTQFCCWDGQLEDRDQYWHSKLAHACGMEPLWENGRRCAAGTSCKRCKNGSSYWYGKAWTACGDEPSWGDGTVCLDGTSCKRCKNGHEWWFSKSAAACGKEPKFEDGTRCLPGTSCKRCKNGHQYWHSKLHDFCGKEPGWEDGRRCAAGTSCNRCKNGFNYWYGKGWTACGKEHCWGKGTFCLKGTSCKRCCNGSTRWTSRCK